MTQATSSVISVASVASAMASRKPNPSIMKKANNAPASTDSSVRRLQIARPSTSKVGSNVMNPYSIDTKGLIPVSR